MSTLQGAEPYTLMMLGTVHVPQRFWEWDIVPPHAVGLYLRTGWSRSRKPDNELPANVLRDVLEHEKQYGRKVVRG